MKEEHEKPGDGSLKRGEKHAEKLLLSMLWTTCYCLTLRSALSFQ